MLRLQGPQRIRRTPATVHTFKRLISHEMQFGRSQLLQQGRGRGTTSLISVQLEQRWPTGNRRTCGHVIGPLSDVITENLGQRGRRIGELACPGGHHGRTSVAVWTPGLCQLV